MIMMDIIINIMRDVFVVIVSCHYEERSDVIILIL